jgi:TolA-binding protein
MRKVLISLAAAASALAFASPAAAQYYPQPQAQAYGGYGQGYNGQGYVARNGYGQVQALRVRIDAIQNQIRQLDRRNVIRDGSADQLRNESRNIERRLRAVGRNGLSGYEMNDIQNRIARLEQRVQYAMSGRGGHYAGNGYGHNNGNYNRDHDRDDHDGRNHGGNYGGRDH